LCNFYKASRILEKLTATNEDCSSVITSAINSNDQLSHGENTENHPLPRDNLLNVSVPFTNRSMKSANGNREIQRMETEKFGLCDMPNLSNRIVKQEKSGMICWIFGIVW
jgi:hypothetical protein